MKTALIHDWFTGMRGGEQVLEVLAGMFPEAPIYTLLHVPGSVSAAIEAHPIHTSPVNGLPGIKRHYPKFLPLFPAAIESFDLSGYDRVVSSSHCVAKGVVPAPAAAHICYCHSPMRYAWDQEHVYFPKRHGLVARLRGLALSRLRTWDVASAARVDLFVANSRFVAQRIRRYYGRSAEVLAPPVDTEFFTPGPDGTAGTTAGATAGTAETTAGTGAGTAGTGPGRFKATSGRTYALVVAALAPYKRIEQAVEACDRLGLDLTGVGTGPEAARSRRLAGAGVELLGRVDRERLRDLYRGAACLLQPGIEDFGIAPVEARACGTPVVALGLGGVLDVVEDGIHGVLYSEPSTVALAAAIEQRLHMSFEPQRLRERALTFSTGHFTSRFTTLLDTASALRDHELRGRR